MGVDVGRALPRGVLREEGIVPLSRAARDVGEDDVLAKLGVPAIDLPLDGGDGGLGVRYEVVQLVQLDLCLVVLLTEATDLVVDAVYLVQEHLGLGAGVGEIGRARMSGGDRHRGEGDDHDHERRHNPPKGVALTRWLRCREHPVLDVSHSNRLVVEVRSTPSRGPHHE